MSTRRESPLSEDWIPSHQCSLDLRLEILGDLPFFNQLPEDEIAKINRTPRPQSGLGYKPPVPATSMMSAV